MNININLFDFLYYGDEIPFKQVAGLMDIAVSTLYVNVTGRYGRKLRTTSEAHLVAIKKGRWHYPNPPKDVDWERFKQMRREDKSLTFIGRTFDYAQGHKIAIRARKGGYLEERV